MPKRAIKLLRTTDEVIDALGGTTAVANMLGRKPPLVSQWRRTGTFAPEHFMLMTAKLRERGYSAGPELWRQTNSV